VSCCLVHLPFTGTDWMKRKIDAALGVQGLRSHRRAPRQSWCTRRYIAQQSSDDIAWDERLKAQPEYYVHKGICNTQSETLKKVTAQVRVMLNRTTLWLGPLLRDFGTNSFCCQR